MISEKDKEQLDLLIKNNGDCMNLDWDCNDCIIYKKFGGASCHNDLETLCSARTIKDKEF